MNLNEYLKEESCLFSVRARDKDALLGLLADRAAADPRLAGIGAAAIHEKLAEREAQGSTGSGNGIAIPHARIEGMKDFYLGIATSHFGVPFDAVDKKRVNICVCILGPAEDVGEHLQILAGVSRAFAHTGLARELVAARSARAVYEAFVRHTSPKTEPEAAPTDSMQLLTVVVYIDEYLHRILEFFIESGIEGATIVDAVGMGHYISNIPLFAEFIGFLHEKRNAGQVILAAVPKSRAHDLVAGIEEITGDLDTHEGAMVMIQDLAYIKGSMKMF